MLFRSVQINIPNGTYLDHEEEGYQDHIIVEDYNIALNPAENKEIQVVALCAQSSNACPQVGSKFVIKPYDNKKVLDLCKLIMETKEFEYTGQNALWEMLNNGDPNNIEDEGSLEIYKFNGEEYTILDSISMNFDNTNHQIEIGKISENQKGMFVCNQVGAHSGITYGFILEDRKLKNILNDNKIQLISEIGRASCRERV